MCIGSINSTVYLGYQINQKGAEPVPEKVAAIVNYPKSETIAELRHILGMVYRRFIENAAGAQAPLNAVLQDAKKKNKRSIVWTEEAKKTSKNFDAALLAHPKINSLLILITKASNVVVLVFQQKVNSLWESIFFSKKFSPQEIKYNTYDHELTAVFKAIKLHDTDGPQTSNIRISSKI